MKSYLSKNQSIFLMIFILVLGSFILAHPVEANFFGNAVAQLIGWIVYAFVYIIGLLIMLVMWVLIKIAQYNDFINAAPVSYGWTIVRDVCNMFFILILLIIAFATILRVEKYSFKTLLPKLILMAVLINFSKLICGIFIDFAQVIMLTFVNGFKDIGTGNLTNMLGIDKIMSVDGTAGDGDEVTNWSIVGAYMLALMYSVIALITLVTMVSVLAMRMIMIWIYVVLSPLAYLLSAFPAGEKYASQWWEEFSKNLIVGPILAFFIWLSFVSLGGVGDPQVINDISGISGSADSQVADRTGELSASGSASTPTVAITEAGSPNHMIKFIISIAMLIGGLQISQSLGGQAGGMAGKGMAKIQGMGSSAMKHVGTGLKRSTGIERAQMAYKAYQSGKATDRSIRATQDASKISGAVGNVKQKIAAPIKGGLQKLSTRITDAITPKSTKAIADANAKQETVIKTKDDKLSEIQKNRENATDKKKAAETMISDIDKKAAAKKEAIESQRVSVGLGQNNAATEEKLKAVDAEAAAEKKEPEKMLENANEELTNLDQQEATALTSAAQELSAAAKEISVAQNRKDRVNKMVGKGLAATLGVGLGVATGGVGAVAGIGGIVAGAIASGLAGLAVKNKVDNAGKADLARVGNYNIQKIENGKNSMKGKTKAEIMKTIKDPNSNPHEHAAAVAIALEEGHFGTGEAGNKAAAEQKAKVATNMKDEKVDNYLDAASKKNYVSTSAPYSTLKNPDATPEQKASANSKIAYGLEHNTISISKDMDAESIPAAINGIVSGLKTKTFAKQFDDSDDAKQKAITISLTDHIKSVEAKENKTDADHEHLYKAKSHLAAVNDYNLNSFGASSNLSDPVQQNNAEYKKRFLDNAGSQEIVKSAGKDGKKAFLEEIKVRITANGDVNKVKGGYNHDEMAAVLAKIIPKASIDEDSSANKAITKTIYNYLNQNLNTPPKPGGDAN